MNADVTRFFEAKIDFIGANEFEIKKGYNRNQGSSKVENQT